MHVRMCACTVLLCACASVCMHVCMYACARVFMHYVAVCMYACVCTCMRVCALAYALGVSSLMYHFLFLQSAVECSGLLRTLHGLEQVHLRRSLALQQEEDFAKAHRQLAIFQRNELHNIFFTQIKSAVCQGELKPEAAKMLLQDYSDVQVRPQIRLAAAGT